MQLSKETINKFLIGISIALVILFFVRIGIDLFVKKEAIHLSILERSFDYLLPGAIVFAISKYDKK